MSGQVHDVGSIINFWPNGPASGTALVVTRRDSWTVHTELLPVILVPSGRYVVDAEQNEAWLRGES